MTDTHDLVSREEALAALDSEQQLRQSNYDEAFARSDESDVATCRAEAQRIAEIKVLWNILAGLPAIPLDDSVKTYVAARLATLEAYECCQEYLERTGDIHDHSAEIVELRIVLEKLRGALPVLETKKETK